MEKMSVKEFINEYKTISDEGRERLLDSIVVKTYMPYETKVILSKKIISTHRLDNEGRVDSDTCSMHLSLISSILKYYTIFDFEPNEAADAYDLLQENNLLDEILEHRIGRDIVELRVIFSMCQEDFNTNHMSVFAFADKCAKKALSILTVACEKAVEYFKEDKNDDGDE